MDEPSWDHVRHPLTCAAIVDAGGLSGRGTRERVNMGQAPHV